ncbi:MAG: phosphatase PAP2 family protein [Novosphingobium sp.]
MVIPSKPPSLPARGWRIDPKKALLASLFCWLGFAGVVVAVNAGATGGFDRVGLMIWRSPVVLTPLGPVWLLEAVRDLTALGGVLLRNVFALGAVVALLFISLRREAALLALTIASGWLVDGAIKHAVGRPRPTIVPHLTEAGGSSFPSGHSFNSAVVYIAIALAFATLSTREAVRITIIGAALLASLVIAWSRVWLGVHFPSDVVAGWLGGAGWAFLAQALLYRPAKAAAEATGNGAQA